MKITIEMINNFLCPGCINGSSTNLCSSVAISGNSCSKHHAGTMIFGAGKLFLGMPKGFNRTGEHAATIRCYSSTEERRNKYGEYDRSNIPVWAMVIDGYLFARVYSPRVNHTEIHVVKGGTIDDVPGAINVGEFVDEID